MEFFHNPTIDWLGKKWYFVAFSLVFSIAGIISLAFWHHLNLGVDFKGGTLIYVKFNHSAEADAIRHAMDAAGIHDARIQPLGSDKRQVIISLTEKKTTEQSELDAGRQTIVAALLSNFEKVRPEDLGKIDLDNVSHGELAQFLQKSDPEGLSSSNAASAAQKYSDQARAIVNLRDHKLDGLFSNIDQLNGVADPAVINLLKTQSFISGFNVFRVEIIGPQVGAQLRKQASLAVVYSLIGMLVYLWFRFELIYGVAAVIAVFHDTLITIGAFSLTNQEMSLTVIAAILTLIGYSMNDTIVVFDRIRENLRISRRENLTTLVNRSINQTLSRTVLTSGLTFLTVLSLYIFGGEVLRGFSFALVVGILIGTYSSIAIASPMLVAYQEYRQKRGKKPALPASKRARV